MDGGDALSWRAIRQGQPVVDVGGGDLGTVVRLLGDEGADIFHGIVVRRGLLQGDLEVAADQVVRITAAAVHTTVPGAGGDAPSPPPPPPAV